MLTTHSTATQLAFVVCHDLCGVTPDGLTPTCRRCSPSSSRAPSAPRGSGETRYQASVNSIATAIGKSRDVKAVQLRVEPWLIECGYVQVLHGGRALTDLGVMSALRVREVRRLWRVPFPRSRM
jgi:hypothetical protein